MIDSRREPRAQLIALKKCEVRPLSGQSMVVLATSELIPALVRLAEGALNGAYRMDEQACDVWLELIDST